MADTLTPEEKKRLTEELTKYANEGASDDDLRQFRDAFISELKKKGGGQPVSGPPQGQPGKPSAPSTGQSAFDAWNPAFKKAEPETELKVERESKFAPKQLDGAYDTWRKSITKEAKDYGLQIGYEKSPEEDEVSLLRKAASDQLGKKSYTPEEQQQIQEIEDKIKKGEEVEMLKPEMGVGTGWRLGEFSLNNSPEDVSSFYRKASEAGLDDDSSNILNLTNKKAEGSFYGESTMASRSYAEKAANLWFDLLSEKNPSKASYEREKYNKIKSTPENERSSDDEKFLRDTEGRAIELHAAGKNFRLNRVTERINDLNGRAVTDEQKLELDNLFEEYGKLDNSLMGMEKADKLNRMQYGYISRVEAAEDEWKQDRDNKLSQGDGKLSQFFQSALGAMSRGAIGIGQVPKVFGDLIGDKDYDYWDETYDSLEGTKRGISAFYNDLPRGKKASDLPFTARLALVGGNAVGSASLFIGGGILGGASRVGQTAATFGTAFLTSEADYYQEALDAGMDSQSAALFGTYLATQSAILESIIPDVKYLKTPEFRRSVRNSVMKRFNSGMPLKESMKFGYKDALKTFGESGLSYLKTGTKEAFIEELPTQIVEDFSKTAANAVGQKKYFNDTFDGDAYVDAILGSFVAGPAMNLLSRPDSKSPVQEEVIREIAERKDKLLKKGTASDKATEPDSKKEIEDTAEILNGMKAHSGWNNMSREEQNHALATAQQIEVIKKEQEKMKKIGIEDETKNEQIKQLENEVNEMFSMQLDRQKQAAYDAKLKAIEDEFNKSIEGEEYPVQEDERDQEIVELQKQREERGVNEIDTFFGDMKPMVPFAVERMEQGQPVAQSVKQAASNYLYKKYKELTDMKSNPNRMMTRQQIANVQKQLEQDIRTLEGTTETKAQVNDQENTQGVPSEVGVGQEPVTTQPVEVTSEEAPATGGVLQAQEQTELDKVRQRINAIEAARREGRILADEKPNELKQLKAREKELASQAASAKATNLTVGNKIQWDVFGNESMNEWTIAEETTTRGGQPAVKLTRFIDQGVAEGGGRGGYTVEHVVPISELQAQKEVTTEAAPKTEEKPTRKTRLAKLFETSEGEEAVPLIEQSLSESGIKVEVKDDADYNNDDRIKRSQGRGSEGMFVADDGTIILNRDKIKGEWGKTIVFHEGIHPVVNIIRNTDPKRYKAIVEGLKAEAARNNDVARVAADIAASEEYQRRGPESIEDETVVETMARVATGDVNIDKFNPTFREKFIEFMNDIAKALGLKPILTNSPRMEVQRLASQINKMLNEGGKVSDIVGKKNVKEFQNKITLTDTNSVFSNTSSQARFEMKFLEDSEDFTKLVEEGRVVHNATLDDINGETVVIHNPDNFSTGEIKFRGKDLVKGEGGVYFVLLYNDVWASGKKSSASQLASLINESLQKSTDGKGRLVLVKGDSSKNLTSVKGAKALMGVMEILADDGLIPLSAFRKALNIAGKKYGINFDGRSDAKSIHKDIQDKFMNVSNSSFERRGDFVRDVIDAIANQNVLSKEAIAEIAESIGAKRKMTTFSKASILDSVAYATSERMLRDIPNSHVYAVIETSSKVKPEFIGKHESYPWHIVTEDGSKPILYILKDRPFYNDAFVAAKSTEKVKEGERFGDVSRAGLAQRGMGLAKVETKSTGQPAQGILRGKRPTKAEVDKYLSEQEFFRSTSPFAWAVDPVSEETLKKSRIVENEGTYGVVTEDGDIKGVFNPNAAKQREGVPAKKNTLAGLIPKAINAGGIKLDNFDGRLTELYSKNGFRKVSSVPFNEEYAPEGWSKDKDGTPDVVSMVYDPDNKLDIEFKKFDDYGDMISYRDSFVDQARKEVDKKWGEKKVIALSKRDEVGTETDREIAAYASKFLNKFGPYTKANVVQIMNMSAEEKIKLINDTFEARVKKMNPAFREPGNDFYDQSVKRRDEVLALVEKPTGQPSMMKRTPAQIRQAVEDGVDAVEAAIAEGMDPQQAVDENISNQDWYGDLNAAQKEQLNEILQDEFGATASEPKAKTPIGKQIASIVDNYYKLKDGDRSARAAINEILGSDPKLKYIYDNISKINKQLQDAGVITDKTDGCP